MTLTEERALMTGLRDLAKTTEEASAPPRIEARLLSAFREHEPRLGATAPLWVFSAAVAAGVLATASLTVWMLSRTPEPKPVRAQAPETARVLEAPPLAAAAPMQRKRSVLPAARRKLSKEVATEFFPLVYREDLTSMEQGVLVRVKLPRTALVSFGLPMNEDRVDEKVRADVLVGQDGVARAIRFVR